MSTKGRKIWVWLARAATYQVTLWSLNRTIHPSPSKMSFCLIWSVHTMLYPFIKGNLLIFLHRSPFGSLYSWFILSISKIVHCSWGRILTFLSWWIHSFFSFPLDSQWLASCGWAPSNTFSTSSKVHKLIWFYHCWSKPAQPASAELSEHRMFWHRFQIFFLHRLFNFFVFPDQLIAHISW